MKFGWKRDLPDFRDMSNESVDVKTILDKSMSLRSFRSSLPISVDLRKWCSPIENQGSIGSCTANSAVGMLEYYEKRAFNKYLNGSRLFVYKTTRNLEKVTGDQGAYLRDTMKSMILFGVPPEEYWSYDESKFDVEPTTFVYSLAQNYKSLKYFRLDPNGTTPEKVLSNVKTQLAAGLPSMFGFTVYSSLNNSGDILFPVRGDQILGGHAVMTCGFNDSKVIGANKGALLIRNSWGTSWGEQGYGWLPYAYVLNGLAVDFWTLVQSSFVDTELFK